MTPCQWGVLKPAIDRAGEGLTHKALCRMLADGEAFLFTYGQSAAVAFPQGKKLRIGLAGGELSECKQVHRQIRAFARNEGYEATEIVGRDWRRVLPGYEKVAVVLRKPL